MPPLSVYGSTTVLGAGGVSARFGFSRNIAGADTAVLVRNVSGNTPGLEFADGEQTQAVNGGVLYGPLGKGLQIARNGDALPTVGDTLNLGSPAQRWHFAFIVSPVIPLYTPPSSSAPCMEGQITHDAAYEYHCVAANTWKRAPLSSW